MRTDPHFGRGLDPAVSAPQHEPLIERGEGLYLGDGEAFASAADLDHQAEDQEEDEDR
ncbi:MAG: hypothetical protein QOE83_1961 [Actinomycetota bacterium]|nr:hypothetical protein [Actinomycetota bacterium]